MNHRAKDSNAQVHALVRPQPDYEKLASALLELAMEEKRKNADQADAA